MLGSGYRGYEWPKVARSVYLKFGKTSSRMDYLSGISFKQIMLLNIKHINQIIKLLNIDNEDEMSNTYGCSPV